jgi:hypothetical protein
MAIRAEEQPEAHVLEVCLPLDLVRLLGRQITRRRPHRPQNQHDRENRPAVVEARTGLSATGAARKLKLVVVLAAWEVVGVAWEAAQFTLAEVVRRWAAQVQVALRRGVVRWSPMAVVVRLREAAAGVVVLRRHREIWIARSS